MAEFSGGWLISASQRVNWGNSTELEDLRLPHSHVWDLVLAVDWGSLVSSSARLFSPCDFSSSRDSLCMWPFLQQESGLLYMMTSFQEGKTQVSRSCWPRPRTNSCNYLLPDFWLCEKNKLLNVEILCWGILYCGWVIPVGYNTKDWFIWGLRLSPSTSLLLVYNTKAFLRQPGIHCLDYCIK